MTPAVLDTAGVLAILLAMSVMWNRWHRCYDDSFPADGGPPPHLGKGRRPMA